jgi:hypothetical protein
MTDPAAAPDDFSSPEAEQQAIYEKLLRKLAFADTYNTRIIRIKGLQRSGKDHRLLFRTFLANTEAEVPLTFIEDLHNLLIQYGMGEPHTIINTQLLAAVSSILDTTGYFSIPPAKHAGTHAIREYINYAVTLNDTMTVMQIMTERKPDTLEQFKAIYAEYQKTFTPLQPGVL